MRFEKLLRIHHDVFAKDDSSFGLCPWVTFRIDTQGHPPIKQAARLVPLHYRKAVYDTKMKYLEQGYLVPSQSPWTSPILCVPEKDGSVRVAVDYRALNAVTRVPAIPIPRIKEILQRLGQKKLFHSIDISFGYHNIPVHNADQEKTAIILSDLGLPSRQFAFTRLSFGLANAPGIFQAVTDRLVAPAKEVKPENDLGEIVALY